MQKAGSRTCMDIDDTEQLAKELPTAEEYVNMGSATEQGMALELTVSAPPSY